MATAIAAQESRPRAYLISSIWTIARLTLTEAIRRRFWLAAAVVCAFYVLIAFLPIHVNPARAELLGQQFPQFTGAMIASLGSEMVEFFCFLFAVSLGAGTISAELERGTLAVILPKPLPRWAVYAGKWLGINLFLLPLLIILTALLQWAIWMHVQFTEPGLWRALPAMALYPLLFSSLTLCFSTFCSNLLATILPLIMASTAWSEGILRTLGWIFDVQSLKLAAACVVYIVPLNPMSRLHEQAESFAILQQFPVGREHPWPPDPPAGPIDIAWILGYIIAAWVVGAIVFQKRDV